MQTATNLSPPSDIIRALQNILVYSQAIMPDLETPYSPVKFPSTNRSTIEPELKGQSISAIIAERRQQLDAVVGEILGLETVMEGIKKLHQQLVDQKDRIIQSLDLHKRFGSALWRLPTEVLSHIFVFCLPEVKYLSPASKLAPMLLTRICRRWREVAVGMPSLWCMLRTVEVDHGDWQRQAFCYDSWLKRSRGRPLSLALKCVANDTTDLRSLLQPYINQISSLSIYFSREADQPHLFLNDLPELQELTIITLHGPAISHISQCISQLPFTLISLKFIWLLFDIKLLSSFTPVWAHLTHVKITVDQPNAFHHLLQLGPNLSSLTIQIPYGSYQTQAFEPITHTKLQSLRITLTDGPDMRRQLPDLLDALSLPSLRALEVWRTRRWAHKQFKAFLERSKCPLKSLIFGTEEMTTDEQRAEYLALIPSLRVDVVVTHSTYIRLGCYTFRDVMMNGFTDLYQLS
ncbi:uncharacterized protein EDB91DRAFT_47548 [Suillus paluster]|uniref:uncharacterized protein n=1 Tax=Suillus paluster TaxID=48578 RepID=UPI001B8687DC|nr:uncharacterized protein EDB91DRAFT_47548 [Suillus paluster]KAG1747856.1 hypothetical protein EDB91DRAFT_47548 [Suillus paluster]